MKFYVKSKLSGSVSSDGSFRFLPSISLQQFLNVKNIDIFNHSVWTGKRPKKQTEISSFIGRFNNK